MHLMMEEARRLKLKRDNAAVVVEIPNTYNSSYFKRIMHWLSASSRVKSSLIKLCMYILLFDLAFVFLFPFMYMVVTALKSNADLNDLTVNWIPKSLKWQNFAIAFELLSYRKYFNNSLLITAFATLGHAISCSFIGYGFARYKFPFKNLLFFLVIVSFIVPVQTIIVPLYLTYKNFGWLDTYLPLTVPAFFGFGLKGGLFIFLFRQYYMGLPKELEEAAKIDGCGFLATYLRIVMPIATSTFLVTVVLSVVWHWNDFYEPAIYVSKTSMTVLPSRISYIVSLVNAPPEELFNEYALQEGEDVLNNAVVIAGTFLIIAPVLILFTFLQNKFIQGVESAGIKG